MRIEEEKERSGGGKQMNPITHLNQTTKVNDYLNFDADFPIKALDLSLKLEKLYKKVYMRQSCSKRGYHFIVLDFTPSQKQSLTLRKAIGDCYGRIRSDEQRLSIGSSDLGTLFYYNSRKGYAGQWEKNNPKKVLEDSFIMIVL